jgi:uncharacterized protein
MQSLFAYQAAFTAHLRHPAAQPKPRGTASKRMAVYREIVFNNFYGSVSACFPVLLSILGKRKFKQLVRLCFRTHRFDSPLFREIPHDFVTWLQNLPLAEYNLPPFTAQLAHYEWIELSLSNQPVDALDTAPVLADDCLRHIWRLNIAHRLLAYDFPVHLLSKRYQPAEKQATFLCVYQQPDFKLQFIQLNAVSWQLLAILQEKPMTGEAALDWLATQLKQTPTQAFKQFGATLLHDLYVKQVLYVCENMREQD